jgi:hypothetical protein
MTTRPIVFPLSTDFFEGGAGLSSEGETNLVGILNQLGASSGLGSTQNAQAWNGSPLTFTLLGSGHDPGLYTLNASGTILSGDGNGIVQITTSWSDPDLGVSSQVSAPIPNNTPNLLTPYSLTFFSDGDSPITALFEGLGDHPTEGISIYVAAGRSG